MSFNGRNYWAPSQALSFKPPATAKPPPKLQPIRGRPGGGPSTSAGDRKGMPHTASHFGGGFAHNGNGRLTTAPPAMDGGGSGGDSSDGAGGGGEDDARAVARLSRDFGFFAGPDGQNAVLRTKAKPIHHRPVRYAMPQCAVCWSVMECAVPFQMH
jgi:hypothetical protein